MSSCVAVVGAGSWGTALALQLARLHDRVLLWARDPAAATQMQTRRCNERSVSYTHLTLPTKA